MSTQYHYAACGLIDNFIAVIVKLAVAVSVKYLVHAVVLAVDYCTLVNTAYTRGYLCTPVVAIVIGKVYVCFGIHVLQLLYELGYFHACSLK
jgi:hypothetical protein